MALSSFTLRTLVHFSRSSYIYPAIVYWEPVCARHCASHVNSSVCRTGPPTEVHILHLPKSQHFHIHPTQHMKKQQAVILNVLSFLFYDWTWLPRALRLLGSLTLRFWFIKWVKYPKILRVLKTVLFFPPWLLSNFPNCFEILTDSCDFNFICYMEIFANKQQCPSSLAYLLPIIKQK